jgi:short-subunit dehydrogenase
LITGAAGGIGSCTARRLGGAGASLLLTDVRPGPLDELVVALAAEGIDSIAAAADICSTEDRDRLARQSADFGVDAVVNIAGINPFGLFAEQDDAEIWRAMAINAVAPILLTRSLLPVLLKRSESHIVNVGSIFGALGYPGFAVYSASKHAVHGFTEALRRELADTSVRLHYVAPRATQTALSTDRIRAMNEELNVATDPPEHVAAAIESTLRRSRREFALGRSERVVTRLNALLPGLVDWIVHRQLPTIRRYAAKRAVEAIDTTNQDIGIDAVGVER